MDETGVVDKVLFDLVEEFTEKLQAGESVDLERYAKEHPVHAERLREVLPALEVLADLGRSTVKGALRAAELPETPGQIHRVLGEYHIVREIGRGGMGVVYESEQVSLHRRVALKVLPFAAMLDRRQIQRFKNEALAAAQLDHPHIVDVFGVGYDRGVHYYAMRYIDGRTLAAIIGELRRLSKFGPGQARGTPAAQSPEDSRSEWGELTHAASSAATPRDGRTLAHTKSHREDTPPLGSFSTNESTTSRAYFRSIAKLGAQVAGALEHAHQHGVVHRDVKPSNLILEANGKVWVTDFGLAHIDSGGSLTMTGDVVGTLRYMSPEQTQGVPVDHRTDIYSLGVTLYELLTLRPAFLGQDRQELSRKIVLEEPLAPRRINGAVPSDLETIVLKAIEKSPAERYETAQQLADDLGRFLRDQPIRARRPTLLDRAVKWSRRHKTAVAAVAAVLLISTVSLAVSTVLIAKSAGVAKWERDEANSQRNRAEANVQLALQALEQIYIEVAENRFPKDQLSEEDHALLRKALTFYEGFADRNALDPSARRETAKAYRRVGDIQLKLGNSQEAEDAYRRSISYFEKLADDDPSEPAYLQAYAACLDNLGNALQPQRRHAKAENAYRQALALQKGLVDKFPDRPAYEEELARTSNNLGVLLAATQRLDQAEEAFGQARAAWQMLADDYPQAHQYRYHLATSHFNLANLWQKSDRHDEAQRGLNEAVSIGRILAHQFPDQPQYQELLAQSLNSVGALLLRTEEYGEAEGALRDAVPIWMALVENLRNVPEYQEELGRTYNNLALSLRKSSEAEDWFGRALDVRGKLVDQFPRNPKHREDLAETHSRLGEFLKGNGRLHEAAQAYRDATKLWEPLANEFPRVRQYQQTLSKAYNDLGIISSTTGQHGEAEQAYRNALDVLDRLEGELDGAPGHREAVAKICHNLGLLLGPGQPRDAEEFLKRGQRAFCQLAKDFPNSPAYQHALAASNTALEGLIRRSCCI